MRNAIHFSFVIAAFTIAALNPLSAQTPNKMTTAELTNQMTLFVKSWQDAYNRADYTALRDMYTNKVLRMNPNGTITETTNAQIGSTFLVDFTDNKTLTDMKLGSTVAQPDNKVKITGTYTTRHIDKTTGARKSESGTFEHLVVLEKGIWKFTQTKLTSGKTEQAETTSKSGRPDNH